MKKKFLILIALLAASMFVMAEMTVYVHKKDGTKVPYVAATVDSIGFVNIFTISFDANGGDGFMDAIQVNEGEAITLPTNEIVNYKADFNGWNTEIDGTGISYADKSSITPTDDVILYAQWLNAKTEGEENGHEWVDLGLPSETLWATTNVGAELPEDIGGYYAWGSTKIATKWENYVWSRNDEKHLIKYVTYKNGMRDNKTIIELSDDVANIMWGGNWRIPTNEEMLELIDNENCIWEFISYNGVNGYRIISKKNGNSIFMPFNGCYYCHGISGVSNIERGYYWSGTLRTYVDDYAYYLHLNKDGVNNDYLGRYYNMGVRPVLGNNLRKINIFNANGGSGIMDMIEARHGELIKLPSNNFTKAGYEFMCWNTEPDGSGITYPNEANVSIYRGLVLYAQWAKIPDYVDLGLPSGIKWATMNLGANSPEGFGRKFTWGETYPRSYGGFSLFDTHDVYPMILPLSADAANFILGEDWRMPTEDEFKELIDNTTQTTTALNGVVGFLFTSKLNGNSIFMPTAGYNNLTSYDVGYYWSSSSYSGYKVYSVSLYLKTYRTPSISNSSTDYLYSIRPVKP